MSPDYVYDHVFRWGNNLVRAMFFGRRCRVVARGKMNTILVEFEDGRRVVTSRNAVRRVRKDEQHVNG